MDRLLTIHSIKEMLHSYRKNGGDLDYCANEIYKDVAKLLNQQWIEELENMHLNNCQVWSGGDCDCGIERLKLNLKSKMEAENER